ncbi:MAG: acetoacetate decarboxylase [Nocardioides sp.]|nr:acetoacetate decarboxylase [Nocardioides sp.]
MTQDSPATPDDDADAGATAPAYPAAPWPLQGSMWLTLFRLARDADEAHPAGVYGAAFVDYTEPSPLTYSELLVSRLVRRGEPGSVGGRVQPGSITDIWVDSPASMAGGRALWAIPKWLCDFDMESEQRGPVRRTRWAASLERRPIAAARFTDVSAVAPRTPFGLALWQPGLPAGEPQGGEGPKQSGMRGSGRSLPARAHWEIDPDGPLAYLRAARQLASVRIRDFRIDFG